LRDVDRNPRRARTPVGSRRHVCSTQDHAEADHFINGIDTGQVFINAMVASEPPVK
jgi:hypothetical protein